MKKLCLILPMVFCVALLMLLRCATSKTGQSSVSLKAGDTIALVPPFDSSSGVVGRELSQHGFSLLYTGPNSEFAAKYNKEIDISNPDDLKILREIGVDGILVLKSHSAKGSASTWAKNVESIRATIYSPDAVGEIIVDITWRRGDIEYQTEVDTQLSIAKDVVRLLLRKMQQ